MSINIERNTINLEDNFKTEHEYFRLLSNTLVKAISNTKWIFAMFSAILLSMYICFYIVGSAVCSGKHWINWISYVSYVNHVSHPTKLFGVSANVFIIWIYFIHNNHIRFFGGKKRGGVTKNNKLTNNLSNLNKLTKLLTLESSSSALLLNHWDPCTVFFNFFFK